MLFDPKWERLPSFKAHVAKQDPNKTYPYSNSYDCACARYLKERDEFTPNWLSGDEMGNLNRLAGGTSDGVVTSTEWTYGKLLERIEAKEKELVEA